MKLILICSGNGEREVARLDHGDRTLYCSPSADAKDTLARFFPDAEAIESELLIEAKEGESKKELRARAAELHLMLKKERRDAILISHPKFLKVLCGHLEKEGYVIARSELFGIKPYERIRATEKIAHCGYCAHNCPLSNPGCAIGQERARLAGS